MKLSKKTLLLVAPDVNIKIKSKVRVKIDFNGQTIYGNQYTLPILTVFSEATTFEDGIKVLTLKTKGMQAWINLTSHVTALYKAGILQGPEQYKPVLQSHPGRFDSSRVHVRMLNDYQRTMSYQKAIFETVTTNDIVIDIGTGTGILAATAALAGAKHVYAVELNTNMASLAQQLFERNGVADRITIINNHSTQIELPEKADVMISEIIGDDPLCEDILPITEDAVKRLLKPDARLIPSSIQLFALPVVIPDKIIKHNIFTAETALQWREWYGIDFSNFVEVTTEQHHKINSNTYSMRDWLFLTDPVLLSDINLKQCLIANINSTHSVKTINSGVLNGVIVYFEINLSDTVNFSIHPTKATAKNSWGNKIWLPKKPIALKAGDVFELNYEHTNSGSAFEIKK